MPAATRRFALPLRTFGRLLIFVIVLPKAIESSISDSRGRDGMAPLNPEMLPDDHCHVGDSLPEMPLLPITSDQTVRACRALKTSPSRDVFICSYPKSGTTWTQNIVVRLLWEIANAGRPLPEDWHLSHSAPFYEVDQYWKPIQPQPNGSDNIDPAEQVMERLPVRTPIRIHDGGRETDDEYRVFNTHLRPNQLPANAKRVYVVRDPLDVMISFYHHLSNQSVEDGGYTGTFGEFCEEFMDGTILYGKWQDHIEAWLGEQPTSAEATRSNFLLLHYEDMKNDLEKETKRIAKFLLDDNSVVSDDHYLDKVVSRVVPHCTFHAMKQERHRYTPLTVSWKTNPETGKPYDKFVRSGRVGDGDECLQKNDSTSELRDRWINRDVVIARARWLKAKVDAGVVERYL